jgi:hypothetical protein
MYVLIFPVFCLCTYPYYFVVLYWFYCFVCTIVGLQSPGESPIAAAAVVVVVVVVVQRKSFSATSLKWVLWFQEVKAFGFSRL